MIASHIEFPTARFPLGSQSDFTRTFTWFGHGGVLLQQIAFLFALETGDEPRVGVSR